MKKRFSTGPSTADPALGIDLRVSRVTASATAAALVIANREVLPELARERRVLRPAVQSAAQQYESRSSAPALVDDGHTVL